MINGKITRLLSILIVSALLAVLICACASTPGSPLWAGKYTGTIPAADSPGIDVQLTLKADFTFLLVYEYIDTEEGTFIWEGTFSRKGSLITLTMEEGPNNFPQFYRIGSNQLHQLDMEGNEITGEFAEMYILIK